MCGTGDLALEIEINNMIKVPTVLILGAGASMPYNFPSGRELVDRILISLGNYGTITPRSKLMEIGFDSQKIDDFSYSLAGSFKGSVDAFLEDRKEFIDVGKAAIAQALIPYEVSTSFRRRQRDDKFGKVGQLEWYEYLFNQLYSTFEKFGDNEISIITYNYDRSLEEFLFNALSNSSGKPKDACIEQIKKIPIIHLHGKLGNLPWQSTDNVLKYNALAEYGTIPADVIENAGNSIRIIYEDFNLTNDREFNDAYQLLGKAERIYFLGFGYNDINLSRLKIESLENKHIEGSCFGFEEKELHIIGKKYKRIDLIPNYRHLKILEYLRQCVTFE